MWRGPWKSRTREFTAALPTVIRHLTHRINMNELSDLLRGLCPNSHKDLGAEFALRGIRCQTCQRTVHVGRRGVVRGHYRRCFQYLDTKSYGKDLEYTGLESSGHFGFQISDPGADRVTARLRFPLSELMRLHEFLGSVIEVVEQECARNPEFREHLGSAPSSGGPHVVY